MENIANSIIPPPSNWKKAFEFNIILPSPKEVAESIGYHASQDLHNHVIITLFRVAVAFFLAMIIGSGIGILMGRRKKIDDYFDGWVILALNVPALVTIILCFNLLNP